MDRTLKLTNVLCYEAQFEMDELQFDIQIQKMQAYIGNEGATQVGPLIQYISPKLNDQGQAEIQVVFMIQCSREIHSVEKPYIMKNIIRVPDCVYCRYTGQEENLKFAYDKINLCAFEKDIRLKGDSYTAFVDNTEDIVIADVFMEKVDDETN